MKIAFYLLCLLTIELFFAADDQPDAARRFISVKDGYVTKHIDVKWNGKEFDLHSSEIMKIEVVWCNELLELPEIRKELELSSTQAEELTAFLRQSIAKREVIMRSLINNDLLSSSVKGDLKAIRQEMFEKLDEIFLPHQMKRLEEIQNRILLRNRGIVEFLEIEGRNFGISLSKTQLKELEQRVVSFRKEHLAKSEEEWTKLFQSLAEDLIDESSSWKSLDFLIDINPDLLLAQTEYACALSQDLGWETDEEYFEFLSRSPIFTFEKDGRFGATSRRVFDDRYYADISEGVLSGKLGGICEFTDEQVANFESICRTREQKIKQIEVEIDSIEDRQEQYQLRISDGMRQRHIAIRNEFVSSVKATLTDQQLEILKLRNIADAKLRYGPVAMLLVGPLGRTLKLSVEQKESLRKHMLEFCSNWKKHLQICEDELFANVYESIGNDNEKILKEKLGERLTFVPVNLYSLTR